jgi:lipopolysaccharide export system protein LptC
VASGRDEEIDEAPSDPRDFLVAPRRMFKRKKRSKLLLALKIGLPLIAVICVAYIVIWSRVQLPNISIKPTEVTQNVVKSNSDVTVSKVKYDGVDAKNRPFSITAEAASQPDAASDGPAANPQQTADGAQPAAPADNVINLKQIVADMTLVDGAWVALTADNGVYHRDTGTVDLSGNVELFHDTGLQFQTDAATVDLKNDTASGDQPVEGQRPDGMLAAQGFEVRDDGRTVVFTGRAYLKLYPSADGAGG